MSAAASRNTGTTVELRRAALAALALRNPAAKVEAVAALAGAEPPIHAEDRLTPSLDVSQLPGRPDRPHLVAAAKLPQRSAASPKGHAALLHSIAHIEFNAINLALDALWRYDGLPDAYYRDWLHVADEESQHFSLLHAHLQSIGFKYGDFDAHDGLWQMAERTADDVLARMALVPRTLEARGLDASPAVRAKLQALGDGAGVTIIDRILEDEIGHVAIGNRWFRHVCDCRGLDYLAAYSDLAARYRAPRLKGPFNVAARRAAGFGPAEIDALFSEPPFVGRISPCT